MLFEHIGHHQHTKGKFQDKLSVGNRGTKVKPKASARYLYNVRSFI